MNKWEHDRVIVVRVISNVLWDVYLALFIKRCIFLVVVLWVNLYKWICLGYHERLKVVIKLCFESKCILVNSFAFSLMHVIEHIGVVYHLKHIGWVNGCAVKWVVWEAIPLINACAVYVESLETVKWHIILQKVNIELINVSIFLIPRLEDTLMTRNCKLRVLPWMDDALVATWDI